MLRFAAVLAAVVVAALAPAYAEPVPGAVVTTSGHRYDPGDDDPIRGVAAVPVVVPAGTTILHANRDLDAHNITALDVDATGRPLFAGPDVEINEYGLVAGVESLEPGSYRFLCTIHEDPIYPANSMRGTLIVVPPAP